MKLYLSGPIKVDPTGAPARFARAQDYVRLFGHEVVNPIDVPPLCTCADGETPEGEPCSDEHYNCFMRGDIAAMMACEGIVMLPQWRASKGATIEHDLAVRIGFAVFDIDYERRPALYRVH